MDAVRWLRESGLHVEDLTPAGGVDAGADAILAVDAGGRSVGFAVQAKSEGHGRWMPRRRRVSG
jgi:hypothetical protein